MIYTLNMGAGKGQSHRIKVADKMQKNLEKSPKPKFNINDRVIVKAHTKLIARISYNKEGESRGLYCKDHKLGEMVDVKHKKCLYEGCQTRPGYNLKGESKGLYCKEHKLDGMIDILSKRCIFER